VAARRHGIPKARYRVQNWPAYKAGLRRRGDLTLWLDEAAVAGWQAPRRTALGSQVLRRQSDEGLDDVRADAACRLHHWLAHGYHRCAGRTRSAVDDQSDRRRDLPDQDDKAGRCTAVPASSSSVPASYMPLDPATAARKCEDGPHRWRGAAADAVGLHTLATAFRVPFPLIAPEYNRRKYGASLPF
jgi:hypothetical protein